MKKLTFSILFLYFVFFMCGAFGASQTLNVNDLGYVVPTNRGLTYFSGQTNNSPAGYNGNAGGLTNLNASQLTTGTIPPIRLGHTEPTNITLLNVAGQLYQGASASSYSLIHGGSGSALSGLPPHGNEVWANQPYGMFVFDLRGDLLNNTSNGSVASTEHNSSNLLAMLRTNNIIRELTNQNVRIAVSLANGWPTNHRSASGHLQWNTNRYPSATLHPSNYVNTVHAQGVEVHVFNYLSTQPLSNGVTEIGIPLPGGPPFWYYPLISDPFAGAESFPCWDITSYGRDMSKHYEWGIDGTWFQDTEFWYASGYQAQVRRMIADFAINPYSVELGSTQQRPWQSWNGYYDETRFNNHGMVIKFMISLVGAYWPLSAEYEANGLTMGSNAHTNEVANSFGIGEVIGIIRPQLYWLTNSMGKTHPAFQPDTYTHTAWSTNEWKHYLGQMAMWNGDVFILGAPYPQNFTNSAFKAILTNNSFVKVWHDPLQDIPYVQFNATNGWLVKQLSKENQVAVLAFNEGATATNITVPLPWNNVNYASNTFASSVDVWTGLTGPTASNTIVLSVGATNSAFVVVTRLSPIGGLGSFHSISLPNTTAGNSYAISNYNGALSVNAPSLVDAFTINSSGLAGVGGFTYGLATLTLHPPVAGGASLSFRDEILFIRDTTTGYLVISNNASGFNGVKITGANGVSAEFTNGVAAVSTNRAHFTILTNDFVFNTLYTNVNQRGRVSAIIGLTNVVSGVTEVALMVDQDGNGSYEQSQFRVSVSSSVGITNNVPLGADLQPRAGFYWTNHSTGGAGSGSRIRAGSCQWVGQ